MLLPIFPEVEAGLSAEVRGFIEREKEPRSEVVRLHVALRQHVILKDAARARRQLTATTRASTWRASCESAGNARLPPDGVHLSSEVGRTRLRTLLATMDDELASADLFSLRTAFATLIAEVGLGPEPELRSCPKCHHLGMRSATRCSTCWSRVIPQ